MDFKKQPVLHLHFICCFVLITGGCVKAVFLHPTFQYILDRKIKAGAVSYLNTKPLLYGFQQGAFDKELELIETYPSRLANMLIRDEIDLGLVPVAVIPILKEHHIVSDYGITCDGAVDSVCLFSNVPLENIDTILLDYQSRTSVALLKILLKEHWKIAPQLAEGKEGYENEIAGTTAGLVIGDRAFVQKEKNKYSYDLGTAWKQMTGLPFVFATWISNKVLPADFIERFNAANAVGLSQIDAVIAQNPGAGFDLKKYYTQSISYTMDEEKRKALKLFLSKMEN